MRNAIVRNNLKETLLFLLTIKMSKKFGENLKGSGEKGIACSQPQTFYQTSFAHDLEPLVKFDWLVGRQSKSDISHLMCIHNPAKAEEALEHIDLSKFLCFTCVCEELFMLCY